MASPHTAKGPVRFLPSRLGFCPWLLVVFLGVAARAQSPAPSDLVVDLSATVSNSSPRIRLAWSQRLQSRITSQRIHRRLKGATGWTKLADLSVSATGYSDTSALGGVEYEYWLERLLNISPGVAMGYLSAGVNVPALESRGKLLLVLDSSLSGALATEITQLERDLIYDGWTVQRISVARTASPQSVRLAIQSAYQADRANVRMVYLLGHIPVPYSGNNSPDGHTDHRGAWPADGYYGDMDGVWTDTWLSNTQASNSRNDNVPGDGKWDQSNFPSLIELAVGRVDLSRLTKAPTSSVTEVDLMRRYLRKAHDYRIKSGAYAAIARRVLIYDGLTQYSTGLTGWHWGISGLGRPGVVPYDLPPSGAWFSTNYAGGRSYLVGYAGGYGSHESISGVGTTADFGSRASRVVFLGMFGSYFGDWDSPNNLMRAVLAGNSEGTSLGLATLWAGAPNYFMHSMGMGETVGYAVRASQNAALAGGTGLKPGGPRWGSYEPISGVFTGLMGDPALRLHVLAPPRNLTASSANGRVTLAWNASGESGVLGYHVYRSASPSGPFTRITSTPLTVLTFAENLAAGQTYTYLVKAFRLELAPGGTYYNYSVGTPVTHTVNGSTGISSGAAVELEPYRVAWIIGKDDSPQVTPYTPAGEFSTENKLNDLRPGGVTRIPQDPQYNAQTNPTRDDDFYCAGNYPAGFNGLTALRSVPYSEPAIAWERALTQQDRTNRVHFVLSSSQAGTASKLRLNFEFASGGFFLGSPHNQNGTGFGLHDVVVRFRNAAGVSTVIYSNRLDRPTRASVEFLPRTVAAAAGPNTIEFTRSGPNDANNSYWVVFDYLSLEAAVPATVSRQAVPVAAGSLESPGSIFTAPPLATVIQGEPVAKPGWLREPAGDFLTLTYERPEPVPEGFEYRVEVSDDLKEWSEEGLITTLDPTVAGFRQVTVRDAVPIAGPSRRFLRLRVLRDGLDGEPPAGRDPGAW